MTIENVTLETVDDLVKYVLTNRFSNDTRYTLNARTNWVFIDKEAGKAWDHEYVNLGYVSFNEPGRQEWNVKSEELQKRKPRQIRITSYFLYHSSTSWRGKSILLSSELGEAIDKVWTKGTRGRYSTTLENVSSLTLPGILKRLGKTEVGKQIKEAERLQKEHEEKVKRNYARRQVIEHAENIITIMNKNPEIWGGKIPQDVLSLSTLICEE